ncbi:hypothetical protein ACLIKD_01445 [Azonexus sp. IMCC34842]|uniref:hypothetical protein n=1 Tax=Azonexus sp. IMCC34842 TaxID=3420950 RepID=UPI003D10306F
MALRAAKDALIGDAAAYRSSSTTYLPGHFRCPERLSIGSPIEGQAQTTCSTTTTRLGRFPWKTLGVDKLLDGYGEPLWYAISPGFTTSPINSNSIGQLQVNGLPNAAVAIVIAPGVPLPGQNRSITTATSPPQPSDYLDLGNADGFDFVSSGPIQTFNDHIVTVTRAELFKAVNMRVLAEVRGIDDGSNLPIFALRGYFHDKGFFPWADTDGDGYANVNMQTGRLPFKDISFDLTTFNWLNTQNQWFSVISYTRLSPNSAEISIGNTVMKVIPCTTLPCP